MEFYPNEEKMKYTESHEWISLNGNEGKVGISAHAREELGEVVYIELPKVGQKVNKGEEVVVVESTKAASDLYSPVSGTIVAVNDPLQETPDILNTSPESDGWLYQIALSDPSELDTLLDQEQYVQLIS
jgi:glycine cleavage system H protein